MNICRKMEAFLSNLPKTLKSINNDLSKEITLVLGNDSCDLDSAICSIVLAHFLSSKSEKPVLPIFNIPKEDVPLRTEVVYCLGNDIIDYIPTQSDLDLHSLTNHEIVLVDHHKLRSSDECLKSYVKEIIDHRQLDPSANLSSKLNTKIELVGSCSTLVAEKLLQEGYEDEFGLKLLRNTILVDTDNLSPKIKKVTPKDISIVEKIEKHTLMDKSSRQKVYSLILNAKHNIDHFTIDQLLRKDLKTIDFPNEIVASVPSIPILGISLCDKGEDLVQVFEDFCSKYKTQLMIVVGHAKGRRDILLFNTEKCEEKVKALVSQITDILLNHSDLGAEIDETFPWSSKRFVRFYQGNVTYSRKKLLPIIMT